MAEYKKVVEMLGENFASLLELAKKWLITWEMNTQKVIHILSHFKKADLQGLIDETHQIAPKKMKIQGSLLDWDEEDNIISLSPYTTDGTAGEDWIKILQDSGFIVTDLAKRLLRSKDFVPTKDKVRNIKILKGVLFFDENRTTKKIREKAAQLNLEKINMEDACWLRLLLSDQQLEKMGLLWIITMHESVKDSDGDPGLLGVSSFDGVELHTYCDSPSRQWGLEVGFAFRKT